MTTSTAERAHEAVPLGVLVEGRRLAALGLGGPLRREHRVTQGDVALEVGVGRSCVGHWEQGIRVPTGEAGRRYCALLARWAAGDRT